MAIDHNLVDAVGDMLDDLVKMLPYLDEESVSDSISWLHRALDKAEAVRDASDVRGMQPEKGRCRYPFASCEACDGKEVEIMDWVCDREYCIVRCMTCGHTAIVPTVPFKPKDMSIETALGLVSGIVAKKAESEKESKASDVGHDDRNVGSDGDMYYLRDD